MSECEPPQTTTAQQPENEPVSHVSSTSLEVDIIPEEPVNGCDSTTEPAIEALPEPATLSSESLVEGETSTPKTSRELKSILALSKEAKLDTNLSPHRRKSDKAKSTPKKSKITDFPVTAESELENFDVKIEEKKPVKKRKSSFGDGSSEGATGDEVRRGLQGISGEFIMSRKPNKDVFCWRCHHDCVQIACETCPRAYHLKCLKQTITDMEHWPCPECVAILKAENTQTRSKAMKGMSLEHLCSLLKFAVKRMIQCNGSEPFIHPVDETQFPEYRNYIINPMTLTMLEKNIKDNLYGSTQAFEVDAKWILHNSIIFNSYQSKLTSAAKTIVKICKQEMAEIENCPSCYLNANTKKHTWFVEVCPKPHLLVWAKLKGFPYWPAKVMSINSSGMADVRFFGAHDKAWVSVKDCYLYSVKDPNSGKQKRNDIIECVKELELYVDNLRELYGRVNFAPFKTPLEADSQLKQLQVFVPNFRDDGKEVLKKVKDAIERSLNNKSSSSENLNDYDERSTESSEEEDDDDEEDEDNESGEKRSRMRSDEKSNGDKPVMTRIDYRTSPSDTAKLLTTPFNRSKRYSNEDAQQNSAKVPRNDLGPSETNPPPVDNHIQPTETPIKTGPTNEGKISPPKLKITDQLIKKLENLDGDKKVEEAKEENVENDANQTEIDDTAEEILDKIEEAVLEKPQEETTKEIIEPEEEYKEPEKDDKIQDKSPESSILDEDEKTEDMVVELDEANIRSIIHSSLLEPPVKEKTPQPEEKESGMKRKREEEKPEESKEKEDDNLFPPNKMVKLVPIENILQKKPDSVENTPNKPDQLILLKEIRMMKGGKEVKNKTKKPEVEITKKKELTPPVKIKSEIESDEDNLDVQYMEAKRQYLSALNISEKQKVPSKPKGNEIRTRSKTEEKKSKCSDNLSKTIDDVACSRIGDSSSKSEPVKEIYIKSLSKMQTPKHKARKSFPTPNYGKKTIVARKIVPKSNLVDDELTIVNATTLQPTGNVMILPKLHYNKPLTVNREINSPPVLAMLPRSSIEVAGSSAATTVSKKGVDGSQNYIPQNEEDGRNATNPGILLNNLLTNTTITAAPVVDVDSQSSPLDTELGMLKEILPENLTTGVSEILCQPPPKLKPKPVGILNSLVEAGVPSSAGPVASRINSMAQKLGDYFRSLLVETINDLGKSNNPEATISSLKYEIEELNHKHGIELAEIRRNVSIVLKDIQKSVIEERERIINETKANCEIEMNKRVEEAKSKQWCANCSKEAQFYCCWNTSYCDYPCQQKHWLKHMSKCTQTANQNQTSAPTPVRTSSGQQLVLTPTAAPKFGALFTKPQKVYLKRANPAFKQTTGSHITLVESTPGNFELLGSGPITVNGKILASTSVIEKIKSGNIVTVTAPSGSTSTQLTSANQKVNPVSKSTVSPSESEH